MGKGSVQHAFYAITGGAWPHLSDKDPKPACLPGGIWHAPALFNLVSASLPCSSLYWMVMAVQPPFKAPAGTRLVSLHCRWVSRGMVAKGSPGQIPDSSA